MNNKSAIKLGFLLAVLTVALVAMTGAVAAEDVWDGTVATKFAGGDGSENNPYLITTGAELAYLAKTVNGGNDYYKKYIKLANDINLNQKEWTPIGTESKRFRGMFDGDNHYISNLKITQVNGSFLGLFGYMANSASSVKNLALMNPSIIGKDRSGFLIGELSGGTVDTCCVVGGTLDCTSDYVGGLIGNAYNDNQFVKITNCTVMDVTIKGSGKVGGILGDSDKITSLQFLKCSVSGTITGKKNVGGIVGEIYNSNYGINGCTSEAKATETGLVEGGQDRGLVGMLTGSSNGKIDGWCYSVDTVGDLVALGIMVNEGNDFSQKNIQLTSDLDLGGIANWTPIGTNKHPFRGYFCGNNHTISNLKIDSPKMYVGLFGYIDGGAERMTHGMVNSIILDNPQVKGESRVGALVGEAGGGEIKNI